MEEENWFVSTPASHSKSYCYYEELEQKKKIK